MVLTKFSITQLTHPRPKTCSLKVANSVSGSGGGTHAVAVAGSVTFKHKLVPLDREVIRS